MIPVSCTGKITIAFICEKFIGLDQYIYIPDIEIAVGKKCMCRKEIADKEIYPNNEPLNYENDNKNTEDLKEEKKEQIKKCNHKCRDKMKCKHVCCKLTAKLTIHEIDPMQTTLSDKVKKFSPRDSIPAEDIAQNGIKSNLSLRLEKLSQFKIKENPEKHTDSLKSEDLADLDLSVDSPKIDKSMETANLQKNDKFLEKKNGDTGFFEKLVDVAENDYNFISKAKSCYTPASDLLGESLAKTKKVKLSESDKDHEKTDLLEYADLIFSQNDETTGIPPEKEEKTYENVYQKYADYFNNLS